ncbi:tryptophan halogenase family protein [Paucibacter sp. Y2R2-4]|uniref:tryptophan halogenase family protein n=1 Tax=Paucibacter sp. Y2R2-4 TaxID=2893553 RepID=UPI0021E4CA19|nr:tryptophan halogenase family protein [Paucibacter sp. Y2R2-4]MCV2350519.1 tryptophan 7-halogenase [Paucibacter sp. Y2R2-4]
MIPYRSILIVGGGTAGWLAAAYLQRVLGSNPELPLQIRLVESLEIGSIGVGEATVPTLLTTLQTIGIPESALFTQADATLKNGIRFNGWKHGGSASADHFDHPFDHPIQLAGHSTMLHWMNLRQRGLTEQAFDEAGVVQTALFETNQSPKFLNSPDYQAPITYAYHLDAIKLAALLRKVASERGVQHSYGEVTEVEVGEEGIQAVRLKDGQRLTADLYIDCTGFAGLLIGKALNAPWVSYADSLLCDRAVACPIAHRDAQQPLRSYTTATARGAGWTWEIDLQSRTGTGYVYSSAHCSDDEALATLRQMHGSAIPMAEPRLLKMRIGHRARMWEKNCLALGLAGGFIEPLESTGIYLIERALQSFVDFLPATASAAQGRNKFNALMADLYDELRDFILLHYVISGRRDTPFWRDYTEEVVIPPSLQELLDLWDEKLPHNTDIQRKQSLFVAGNYFYILAGMGRLPSKGIGQSSFLAPAISQDVLAHIARIRAAAVQQSPTMREFTNKMRA